MESSTHFFCHPVNGDWTQHPLPDPNPMLLASDMPHEICRQCPLGTQAHILVPSQSDKSSYIKYCTITAIAAGLITSESALQNDKGSTVEDDAFVVDALVQRFSGSCSKCPRQKECINQPLGPDAECLVRRDSQSTWVDIISPPSPAADQAAATPAAPPIKIAYIFGWQSAETPEHGQLQLYVTKGKKDFSVTYNSSEATRFKTIEAALDYYRQIGQPHGDPEANIYNGFLQVFQHGPSGLRQVPQITRQSSLFESLPPEDFVQPALIKIETTNPAFGRDEAKLISGGFTLVKYKRDLKAIIMTGCDVPVAWMPAAEFGTYAAAERCLSKILQNEQVIQVSLDGDILGHQSIKRAHAAGFDLYRSRSLDNRYSIVCSSRNWGIWQKYESQADLTKGWADLMNDPKALRG